ncbi:DUF3284 domain-containing protein [[Eubacterium] hominis]|uniref:DUF3284 domain-containing protein n=1 Tax=[Eubacterium] hominis TaxID=2764325 RepID=UPI003A4D2AD3
MEVCEKLYVTAEEFWGTLETSLAYDITQATGKNVRPKQIKKGYSYTKTLKNKTGRKGSVKVTITDFDAPVKYTAKFESKNGVNYISYEIEQLDEEHIGVTYSEGFEGASGAKSVNFKLMSFFYNRGAKKKATRLLRAIEKNITDQKKEIQENVEAIQETNEKE